MVERKQRIIDLYRQARVYRDKAHLLSDYFDARPAARVLDIGCWGQGFDRHDPNWPHGLIRNRVRYCVGIDVEGDVEEARSMGLNFHRVSAEDFQLGESFDVIYAGDVVEHVSNVGRFLDRIREHLAPDAEALITTPNPYFLASMIQKIYRVEPSTHPEHTCLFNVSTFVELCSRHELSIDRLDMLAVLGSTDLSVALRALTGLSGLAARVNAKWAETLVFILKRSIEIVTSHELPTGPPTARAASPRAVDHFG